MQHKWEQVHSSRAWGHYPNEQLVRWACKYPKHDGQLPIRILDLGCGQGASTWFLAREGFDVTAVDFSPTAVAKCRKRLESEGLWARSVVCSLTSLPFKNEIFDAAVDIVSSVHNTPDDMKLIFKEVARVLRPGGKLFSMMPTNLCSKKPFQNYGTISFMGCDKVEDLLKPDFTDLELLTASYDVTARCRVENWVITASRKAT